MEVKILLIEDDKLLGKAIHEYLSKNGFKVEWMDDIQMSTITEIARPFDLLIVDWILGREDGISMINKIKKNGLNIPIIMMTVKSSLEDKLKGFSYGIDDYLTKPFHPDELLARVKAVLSRYYNTSNIMKADGITINIEKNEVLIDNNKIELTSKEFNLLKILLKRKGKILNYDFLIEYIWGEDGSYETLKSHIYMLRKKLKKNIIKSVKGFGYKID